MHNLSEDHVGSSDSLECSGKNGNQRCQTESYCISFEGAALAAYLHLGPIHSTYAHFSNPKYIVGWLESSVKPEVGSMVPHGAPVSRTSLCDFG